ncbi:hypothetical protein EfmAA94_19470 [Enterococcus faecium]|nr:hypothetical protein EfmAA94_19470 [Enterococcus faecium]
MMKLSPTNKHPIAKTAHKIKLRYLKTLLSIVFLWKAKCCPIMTHGTPINNPLRVVTNTLL